MPVNPQTTGQLLVIADDLTGAADTAARCRQAGLPASIFVQPPAPPFPAGAICVTTDSRHLSAQAAAAAASAGVEGLSGLRGVVWYKKIDSTLRGNIGAELDAMLDAVAGDGVQQCAIISPAFPAQDRGLRDGYLVHADSAPHSLSLPDLLAEQSNRPGSLIDLETTRSTRLAEAIRSALAGDAQLLVIDAMSDDDLAAILDAAADAAPHALFCGSAGLVGVLAGRLGKVDGVSPEIDERTAGSRSVLAVVGSGSKMARAQINALRARGGINVIEIDEDGVAGDIDVSRSRHWLLHLPVPAPDVPLDGPNARRLAGLLASKAMAIIREKRPDVIILVGGDTAVHVLERLKARRLDVLAELLPGMPLTQAIAEGAYAPLIVLKAGNHGDEGTLVALVERMM